MAVIGIDLGISNSAAAALRGGRPVIIPSAEGVSPGGKAFPNDVAITFGDKLTSDLCQRIEAALCPVREALTQRDAGLATARAETLKRVLPEMGSCTPRRRRPDRNHTWDLVMGRPEHPVQDHKDLPGLYLCRK